MTIFAEPIAPVREAGGDNEVPRDAKGRPKIWLTCEPCEGTGKVESEKTGKPIKCQRCKSEGRVQRAYSRVTSYIDVLDDKTNLQAWGERMVLVGVHRDPRILEDVGDLYAEQVALERALRSATGEDVERLRAEVRVPKDALTRKAKIAKDKAGSDEKANKGTHLHALSELIDEGIDLPADIDLDDMLDMSAYEEITAPMQIRLMEKLVVNDELKVAGTPDRVSTPAPGVQLCAPDGTVFENGDGLITDLKTGSVEYGGLKMAMQLSVYARSNLYDHATGERTPLENVSTKWGIIHNVPAGTGRGVAYWVDLELGWRAVQVASQVREIRKMGNKALLPFT